VSQAPFASRPHAIPAAVAALALFAALGEWPYGYYTLLRLVVCGAGAYTAFVMYQWEKAGFAWLFALIAVLFNPVVVVHLSRDLWQPIDLACGIVFAIVALVAKKRSATDSPSRKRSDGGVS
jgi:hypothetical protein